jgi:hypothetical protein
MRLINTIAQTEITENYDKNDYRLDLNIKLYKKKNLIHYKYYNYI